MNMSETSRIFSIGQQALYDRPRALWAPKKLHKHQMSTITAKIKDLPPPYE